MCVIICLMKNLNLLEEYNEGLISIPHIKNKNIIEYKSKVKVFDFIELKRLIYFFQAVDKKFNGVKFIKCDILYENEMQFADKLTYILLECLIYYEKIIKNRKLSFKINNCHHNIFTEGIWDSCLNYTENNEAYRELFNKTLTRFHYRKVISYEEQQAKPDTVSFVMAELTQFLETCGITQKYAHQAAEISVELIDNAIEHSQSDCLLDIDVSRNSYFKGANRDEEFFAVNIAIVNFSECLLGEKIGKILQDGKSLTDQFIKLNKIKLIHEKYFSDKYTEKQFYMMSAFQNKITSREHSKSTGGRGLTRLIERLQESSVSDICYVVSNDNCLFFIKNFIGQDEDKWVGFNEQNNITFPPSEHSLKQTPLNIIGTAYNLTFVFKKENNDD